MNEGRRVNYVVGVRLTRAGRVLYFDPGGEDLDLGDRVVIEADNGEMEATVVIAPSKVLYSELRGPLSPVLRKIGGEDSTTEFTESTETE